MTKNIIKVNLESRSYNIIVGNNLGSDLKEFLNANKYSKIVVVTDSNIDKIYENYLLDLLAINFEKIVVEAGEKSKSFAVLEKVCEEILQKNIDRKTLLIAFGGGVIGDLTGFMASILLRGIDFIQIPTSLLAMVDSSVGGKTAINAESGKNLIGSFYQPKLVLCDLEFLKTLPLREFRNGYAEVIKYGLIFDKSFFSYLQKNYLRFFNYDQEVLTDVVKRCCEIKAQIVEIDEKESSVSGVRAILNFGHSFGHVFEAYFNYSNIILHGEAVAIGMIMAGKMSCNLKMLSDQQYHEIVEHIQKTGFVTDLKKLTNDWSINQLIIHLYKDKKVENKNLVFILLSEIGKALVKKDVALSEFEKVLKEFL